MTTTKLAKLSWGVWTSLTCTHGSGGFPRECICALDLEWSPWEDLMLFYIGALRFPLAVEMRYKSGRWSAYVLAKQVAADLVRRSVIAAGVCTVGGYLHGVKELGCEAGVGSCARCCQMDVLAEIIGLWEPLQVTLDWGMIGIYVCCSNIAFARQGFFARFWCQMFAAISGDVLHLLGRVKAFSKASPWDVRQA